MCVISDNVKPFFAKTTAVSSSSAAAAITDGSWTTEGDLTNNIHCHNIVQILLNELQFYHTHASGGSLLSFLGRPRSESLCL